MQGESLGYPLVPEPHGEKNLNISRFCDIIGFAKSLRRCFTELAPSGWYVHKISEGARWSKFRATNPGGSPCHTAIDSLPGGDSH